MNYEYITRKLQEAIEDTYSITSQKWFDKQWQGVDTLIKVMNIELAYMLNSHQYTAYIKCVDGLKFDNTLKTYSMAIKNENDEDIIFGKIYCHDMSSENHWSCYTIGCILEYKDW